MTTSKAITYKPKKRKRAKTHGFLTRQKTSGGKRTVRNRRRKGRARLSTSVKA